MPSSRNGGVIILIILVVIVLYSYTKDNIPSLTQLEQTGTTSQRDLSLRIDNRVTDFFEGKTFSVIQQENKELGVIIEFDSRNAANSVQQELEGATIFKYSDAVASTINKGELDRLIANPSVKSVYLDEEVSITLDESVPLINADDAWNVQVGNTNITGSGSVCVIDTGIDYTHPDLDQNYIGGIDLYNNDNNPMDDHGHGTHVAGIVAGNGLIKGVAPDAKLVGVKVLNSAGSGLLSTIVSGIEWCADNKELYNIKVITISIGGSSTFFGDCDAYYPQYVSAVNASILKNIVVTAASGNDGNILGMTSPGCISNIISVGATDKSDNIAPFSNYNSLLDVMAPGVSIYSSIPNNAYASKSGTSMATPHVAGLINLIQQHSELNARTLKSGEISNIMRNNGRQIFSSASGLVLVRIDAYGSLTGISNTTKYQLSPENIFRRRLGRNTYIDNSAGNLSWSDAIYAKNPDEVYAKTPFSHHPYDTNWIVTKDFSFNIPLNANITGVYVSVSLFLRKQLFQNLSASLYWNNRIELLRGNTLIQEISYSSNSLGDVNPSSHEIDIKKLFPSSGITPSEINSPEFGVRYRIKTTKEENNFHQFLVDDIEMIVFYNLPSGTADDTTTTTTISPLSQLYISKTSPNNIGSFGDALWNQPQNAINSDDIYSSLKSPDTLSAYGSRLDYSDFGFNIPPNSRIDGVLVQPEFHVTGSGGFWLRLLLHKWITSGSESKGAQLTTPPLNAGAYLGDTLIDLGGKDDTWETLIWLPEDINEGRFGIDLGVFDPFASSPLDIYIDSINMTVYYTPIADISLSTTISSTTSSIPTTSILTTTTSTSTTIPTTISTSILTTTSSIPTTISTTTSTSFTTSIIPIATGNATSQIGGLASSREGQLTTTSQSTTTVQTIGGGTSTATTTSGIQQPIQPEKINPLVIIGIIALIWWLFNNKR